MIGAAVVVGAPVEAAAAAVGGAVVAVKGVIDLFK